MRTPACGRCPASCAQGDSDAGEHREQRRRPAGRDSPGDGLGTGGGHHREDVHRRHPGERDDPCGVDAIEPCAGAGIRGPTMSGPPVSRPSSGDPGMRDTGTGDTATLRRAAVRNADSACGRHTAGRRRALVRPCRRSCGSGAGSARLPRCRHRPAGPAVTGPSGRVPTDRNQSSSARGPRAAAADGPGRRAVRHAAGSRAPTGAAGASAGRRARRRAARRPRPRGRRAAAARTGRTRRWPPAATSRTAGSPRAPAATSGGRKSGVPSTNPVAVRVASPVLRAIPKSIKWACPSASRTMLPGLTSRCSTPCPCAASSAPAMLDQTRAAATSSRIPRVRRDRRATRRARTPSRSPCRRARPAPGRCRRAPGRGSGRNAGGARLPARAPRGADPLLGLGVPDVGRLQRHRVAEAGVVGEPHPPEPARTQRRTSRNRAGPVGRGRGASGEFTPTTPGTGPGTPPGATRVGVGPAARVGRGATAPGADCADTTGSGARAANRAASRSPTPPDRPAVPGGPAASEAGRLPDAPAAEPSGIPADGAGAGRPTGPVVGRAARDRCTTAQLGAPSESTTGIPRNAPAAAPSHRCAAEPAGTFVVSAATASTGQPRRTARASAGRGAGRAVPTPP